MLFFSIGDVVSKMCVREGQRTLQRTLDESAQFLLRIALFRSQ